MLYVMLYVMLADDQQHAAPPTILSSVSVSARYQPATTGKAAPLAPHRPTPTQTEAWSDAQAASKPASEEQSGHRRTPSSISDGEA